MFSYENLLNLNKTADCPKAYKNCTIRYIYMESCYYLCPNENGEKMNYKSNACGKNLVGVSSHDEARFLEIMIVSYKLQRNSKEIKKFTNKFRKFLYSYRLKFK